MKNIFLITICTLCFCMSQAQAQNQVTLSTWGKQWYTDDTFVYMLGEVKNNTSGWVRSIWVKIKYFDASGKLLVAGNFIEDELRDASCSDEIVIDFDCLPAAAVVPFKLNRSFDRINGVVARCEFEVVATIAEKGDINNNMSNATISKLQKNNVDDAVEVSGEMSYSGAAPCHNPSIVVAAYDNKGNVLDVRDMNAYKNTSYDDYFDDLKRTDTGYFSTTFWNNDLKAPVADVKAFATCSCYND